MKTVKAYYIDVSIHHESTHFELLIPDGSAWLDERIIEDHMNSTLILSFLVDTTKPRVSRKFKLVIQGDEVGDDDCHMESFHLDRLKYFDHGGIKHLFETIKPTKQDKVLLDDQQVDQYVRRSVREHEEDRLDSMGL